jgi:hypothetical protein
MKRIGSILPSIRSYPRPMYLKTSQNSQGTCHNNNSKSSSGHQLCNYFARKRIQSKRTVISPGASYYTSSHTSKKRHLPPSSSSAPGPTPSFASSTTTCTPTSRLGSIYHAFSKASSCAPASQVISTDSTVSVSIVPPHAKPNSMHKHKEVRSRDGKVGPRGGGTSIALDSASSIHLFKNIQLFRSRILGT